MSDSQLLNKTAELRTLNIEYNRLRTAYTPATSTNVGDTFNPASINNINALSNTTPPLVIPPGEDYGEHWKYVGPADTEKECWNKSAGDPRLFKSVVFTGTSNSSAPNWNNKCYGLMYNAPASAAFTTANSAGYWTMTGKNAAPNPGFYTKLGIGSDMTKANDAAKLVDVERRIATLTREIAELSGAGINEDLNKMIDGATDTNSIISQINKYMNDNAELIKNRYAEIEKRKKMNNVYAEINEQKTLFARKYQFILYFIIAICIIAGYASYTSKLPLLEQATVIKNFVGFGWWTNWWVITIAIIILIFASFGWDMKGNIMMVIRYITDLSFWTGQLWWVGITILLLIVIFLHASFKSFFVDIDAGLKSIQDNLDNNN
jgi:hypothetical protein